MDPVSFAVGAPARVDYEDFIVSLRKCDFGTAKRLLEQHPGFAHVHPSRSNVFSLWTASAKREECACGFRWLLQHGAHPHFDLKTSALSPLFSLAAHGRYFFIDILVDHFGVDVLRAQPLIEPQSNSVLHALRNQQIYKSVRTTDPAVKHPSFLRGGDTHRAGLLEHSIRVGNLETVRELLRCYPELIEDEPVRWVCDSNSNDLYSPVGVGFLQMARELKEVYPESVDRGELAVLLQAFVANASALAACKEFAEAKQERLRA